MKKHLTKKYKRWVLIAELLLVLMLFPIFYNFYMPLGERKTTFYSDGNLTETLNMLKTIGYDINDLDYLLAPWIVKPKRGWFRIDPDKKGGRIGFFSSLFEHREPTMRLRIYGGDNITDMLQRLANDTKISFEALKKAYTRLKLKEGDILSGWYKVARHSDAVSLLAGIKSISDRRVALLFAYHGWRSLPPYAMHVLRTIASVIQKETMHIEEMPLISSVIYNRLKKGMKLQMDGTLNYGPYSHSPVTPERIKNDTTYYNTYRYKGLPPAPLGTFSLYALDAAMYPAKSDYIYFMLQKNGKHHFSTTYKEHVTYLNRYKNNKKSQGKRSSKAVKKLQQALKKTSKR
jgi:UPF0755 protein